MHEEPVNAVDASWDGLMIVCGVANSSLGLLDLRDNAYRTLLRSHMAFIKAIDVQPATGHILTLSDDRTLKIWDVDSLEALFEFASPHDAPLCVSYHPEAPAFVCGF